MGNGDCIENGKPALAESLPPVVTGAGSREVGGGGIGSARGMSPGLRHRGLGNYKF